MPELNNDQIKLIIMSQMSEWTIESKKLEIAIQVHRKIKSDQPIIDNFIVQMTKAEQAIEELNIMLKAIDQPCGQEADREKLYDPLPILDTPGNSHLSQ